VSYAAWLAVLSVGVAVVERIIPARPAQRALRPGLGWDLAYLVFNGHFLGVGLAAAFAATVGPALDVAGVSALLDRRWVSGWPLAAQAIVALAALDFVQWNVHRLLHAVPALWRFHQVHHSVRDGEMDWIVSFRFHWAEVVVYKTAQYVPLALLGFSGEALMIHAVLGTLVGHLNHANLDWGHGAWRYLLNSPRMHIWHHDADAKDARNFGIILSVWDWIFGTASMPTHPPRRLGFDGDCAMPPDFFRRSLWPLRLGTR
jgi:sterol desaturase/sphingolipid hydroxylase (fatty acid hydroxylase superfamily)